MRFMFLTDTIPPEMKTPASSGRVQRWVAAFLLAMTIAHLVIAWQERKLIARGYGDFSAFYTAGLMARKGMGHQLYDRRQQWDLQQQFASEVTIRQGPMPFIRPPFEALLFLPFTFFSYPVALALWSVFKLGIVCVALSVLSTMKSFARIYPAWFESILCLGFFPVFLDFYQGQDAVLLLLLIVLALKCLSVDRDIAAGVILGLGLFKFQLVIPIVIVLVLAGRARVLAGFVLSTVVLVAVSCGIAGSSFLRDYPAYLLQLNRSPGIGMVTAQSMPNLRGLLTVWVGRAPYPGPIHWVILPVAVATLAYTAWLWRSRSERESPVLTLGFSLAISVTILTSYYAYSYDLTLLLVPLMLIAADSSERSNLFSSGKKLLLAAFPLLICAPLYWALILRWDRPYLLSIPVLLLAAGLVTEIRQLPARP
jgi:glycosyl transferase family 87